MRFDAPEAQGQLSEPGWRGFTRRPADLGQGSELASGTNFGATALLTDGPTVLFLAVAFIVVHIATVLRREARWIPPALTALVVVGAGIRWVMAPETIMNAWSYDRVVPLARAVFEGPTLAAIVSSSSREVFLTDVIFGTTFVIAALTPLVVFAHARYVLRSATAALAVTAVFCFLPHHIRFARSDVEYVQSLATSSLTFVLIYTALLGESKLWRWASASLVPLLSFATYQLRPENMFFAVIDIGAVLLVATRAVPLVRRAGVAVAIVVPAAVSFVGHLWGHYSQQVVGGLSWRTIQNAVELALDHELNTLINPWVTPPLLLVAAAFGVWSELSRREYRRLAYLGTWLVGFFCIHAFVRPSVVAMQARYHLHLVTPFLLLVGLAVPDMLRGPKWSKLVIAGYVASMPLVHRGFITDVAYSEMQEFDFVRRHRKELLACDVIEYVPTVGASLSPIRRVGTRLTAEGLQRPRVFSSAEAARREEPRALTGPSLSGAHGSKCLLAFEGLTCHTWRERPGAVAEACAEVRALAKGAPALRSELTVRDYDEARGGKVVVGPSDETVVAPVLKQGEKLSLRLYRVELDLRFGTSK